jgi:uncharacterized membrane protein HdeD (DUF308 family)
MLSYIESLATSPFVIGIMMLLLNVGSRYIVHEFSDSDEEYSNNILLRRVTIFAVCFVGTRNLIVSILLTAGFVILASGFIRGKSFGREGMENHSPDSQLRQKAGLPSKIDAPGYDKDMKPMFSTP